MHVDNFTGVPTKIIQLCDFSRFARPSENETEKEREEPLTKRKKLTLLDLPPEMVCEIADHLDGGSRAAFALASKPLLCTLGTKAVYDLDRRSRLGLLLIFERHKMFPGLFLCTICRTFHYPRLPKFMSEEGYAGYIPPGLPFVGDKRSLRLCERTNKWTWNLISYGMLASIMRSHRHWNSLYPASLLDADKFRGCKDKQKSWLSITANFKIVNGNLMLKTEVVLCPAVPRQSTQHVVYALLGLSRDDLEVINVCAHRKWLDIFPFILPPAFEDVPLPVQSLACFWSHSIDCDKQECGNLGFILQIRKSCDICYTEFEVQRCDLEGSRHRAMRLTTWKDLGSGGSHHSHQWVSHFYPGYSNRRRSLLYGIRSLFDDD